MTVADHIEQLERDRDIWKSRCEEVQRYYRELHAKHLKDTGEIFCPLELREYCGWRQSPWWVRLARCIWPFSKFASN